MNGKWITLSIVGIFINMKKINLFILFKNLILKLYVTCKTYKAMISIKITLNCLKSLENYLKNNLNYFKYDIFFKKILRDFLEYV